MSERLPQRHSTGEERRRTRRARSDAGMAGGIEALPFGLLDFVVGALLTLKCLDRRYLLAVSNHTGGVWEITGVGYPLVDTMVDNDLQAGGCPRCGLEVEAPAKQAQCPACFASCGLT